MAIHLVVSKVFMKSRRNSVSVSESESKREQCHLYKMVLASETISAEQNHQGKILLDRIVAMLTKMGGRSYSVKESEIVYYSGNDDPDPDTNTNKKRTKIFSKKEGGEASLILYN